MTSLNALCVGASILNAVTAFASGLFILKSNPGSQLHQLWWWMSLAIAIWATGLTATFAASPEQYSLALFAVRLADAVAILIPLFYLHFIITFLQRTDQRRVLTTCYGLSLLLLCFGFSPAFISGVKPKMGITHFNDAGPLFWAFFALYVFEPIYAIQLLWKARRAVVGTHRAHLTYVMAAGIVGFFVGATWFPLCFNIPIPPVGGCFVWLYCLFVAWAVFKYHLFDIHVVIRKSLVYSLLVTLLTTGYFGLAYAAERILRAAFGYQSITVSLSAFALMALAFQPLKLLIQRVVDHLLFRAPQHELARQLELLEREVRDADKARAVGRLAAGIAHEIKNPLTALRTFMEFLPERQTDPQFMEQFRQVVSREMERLEYLARGLVNFARPQSSQREPVDLRGVLDQVAALTRPDLLEKGITLDVRCDHDGAMLIGDASQLSQAFLNLVLNARDAMARGGALIVTTRTISHGVEIVVTDTGRGIAPEDLPRLFEPFFTRKSTGTGLGLSIVQQILHDHGGTIAVASTPGRGTTFTVRLPVSIAP